MSPEPGAGSSTSGSAFAELLRALRQAKGMTQEEFAVKAGIGVRTLRDLERGRARPQRSTVDLLVAALDLEGADRLEFTLAARRGVGGTDAMLEVRRGVNLPPAPPLVGRDADLASLDAALRHAALVTLVGVAGVGKTSLGWTAAPLAAPRHPGGVAGVAISEVSTEADILATVATVFDVPRIRELPARLAGRPALLLVDAVDRAAEPTAAALRWLQAAIPALRIIATGRHPTRITGEYVWPVGPLEPPPAGVTDLDEIIRYPAARLFLDRLREFAGTQIGPEDAAAVAELVRRLGGLPLALELAAARGRLLAVPEILDRYGDRVLDLGGAADLGRPLRQGEVTTLRDAIAASYRLLEPAERRALRRLAQFRNRWSVELAEPLLAGAPRCSPGSPPGSRPTWSAAPCPPRRPGSPTWPATCGPRWSGPPSTIRTRHCGWPSCYPGGGASAATTGSAGSGCAGCSTTRPRPTPSRRYGPGPRSASHSSPANTANGWPSCRR